MLKVTNMMAETVIVNIVGMSTVQNYARIRCLSFATENFRMSPGGFQKVFVLVFLWWFSH